MLDHAARWQRIGHDRRAAGAHHMGLLPADGLPVRTEDLDVVEVDAGEQGHVGIDHVDGIEPAAQPDLEDHQVQPRPRQPMQDDEGGELEPGQRQILAGSLDRGEVWQQIALGDRHAVDAAALGEMHQVRAGVEPHAPARLARDGLEHRAARALAVGAGDDDHRRLEAQPQPIPQRQQPVQRPPLDRVMLLLAVLQPVGKRCRQGHGRDEGRVHRRARRHEGQLRQRRRHSGAAASPRPWR